MSTTDELLEEMLGDVEEYETPVTDDDMQFWIDEHLRVIYIPKNGVVAGVEGDKNVNKIKFGMNRYYHGFDMSTFSGRILYSNAKGNKNYYNITDMQTNGNTITFSWLVDADAVQYMGKTAFVVYLFKTQGSELRQKFYSTLATLNVLEGMEVDSAVPVEKQTDIIERMKEEISAYAEEVKKSLPADYTAMTEQVSSLKEDLSQLSEEIDDLKSSGTGASDTVMNLILALFRKTKFHEDASTEYSQLEAIVKSDTIVYTITSNLTNVSSNNSATSGEKNSSYICTLTADEGYSIDSVTVVMGGSDITSTAYNNETGEIAISKLTGNIVITASAVSASRVYLYNNGDQCTDITGGWKADGSQSYVDKTIDGLPGYTFICTHYGFDKNSRAMMVNNIDLSNYKKLGFKVYSTLETLSDTVIARLSYLDHSSGSWVRSNKVGVTLNSLGDGWYEGEADLSYSVETLVNNAHTEVSAANGNINQIWLE